MKLYFQIQNYNWHPEHYKYSVEQMMLMLFPGERPEYPEGYAPSGAHGRERRFPSHGIKHISPGTPIGEPGDTAVRTAEHAAGAHPLWRTRKLRPS